MTARTCRLPGLAHAGVANLAQAPGRAETRTAQVQVHAAGLFARFSDPESAGAGTGKCSHSCTPSSFLVWPSRASGCAVLDFGLDRLHREAPVGPSASTRHSVSQILLLLS